jgi:N-carbamoyl-L-amino-acid hydrolase
MGSKVFCGDLSVREARGLRNSDGQTLDAALAAGGLAGTEPARLDPSQHVAFLELHIEQGPVLETFGINLGLVTDIVGIRQDRVTFVGKSNHAGTTPMNLRHDAAACLFVFAVDWAKSCQAVAGKNTVWNLGQVTLEPGAHNVVAGRAVATCQYRDADTERLERMSAAVRECAALAAATCRTEALVERQANVPPTAMHPAVTSALELSAHAARATVMRMPSGAGHDAMIVGRQIPAGMLFVPSKGGLSHSTAEDTAPHDIRRGVEVLAGAVNELVVRDVGGVHE